jgi:DNA-binding response OmpR family regulator
MQDHLLIVEDDLTLSQTLCSILKSELRSITLARTVQSAYQSLQKKRFDVVLLDRCLPDGDGLEIAGYLKDHESRARVLCLSQKREVEDRINGLNVGADDYLPKPFSLAELELRLKKLLSMERKGDNRKLKAGQVYFSTHSGGIEYGQNRVALRKKEAEVLECLFRHKNTMVTREQIVSWVWGNQEVSPSQITLDVYIRRLRVVLGPHSKMIKTVRGYGYMICDQ